MGSIYVRLGSDPLVLTRAQITGVYHRSPPMTRDSSKGYQQGTQATFNSAPLLLARYSLLSLLLAKARIISRFVVCTLARILCNYPSPGQECTLKYLIRVHACLLFEFLPSLLALFHVINGKNLPSLLVYSILLFYSILESRNYRKGTVATDELLCLKNAGTQISIFFTSNE